ncbi:hypothetical protein JW930_00370 [Candidatus Woesearchaeota archaeon]|nr:hypothetical protein [Candidatus Woesearchaeota archaeon]
MKRRLLDVPKSYWKFLWGGCGFLFLVCIGHLRVIVRFFLNPNQYLNYIITKEAFSNEAAV